MTEQQQTELETIAGYSIHPVASLFPLIRGEAFTDLADDIRANGLLEPIRWIESPEHGSVVVDGRNRLMACEAAGVEPRFAEHPMPAETDVLGFVLSQNLRRRQMETGQRAALAAKLMPECRERAKERQSEGGRGGTDSTTSKARDEAAQMAGVNPRYVQDAVKLQREAPDLFERLASGELTIPQAREELKARRPPKESEPEPAPTEPTEVGADPEPEELRITDQPLRRAIDQDGPGEASEEPTVMGFPAAEAVDLFGEPEADEIPSAVDEVPSDDAEPEHVDDPGDTESEQDDFWSRPTELLGASAELIKGMRAGIKWADYFDMDAVRKDLESDAAIGAGWDKQDVWCWLDVWRARIVKLQRGLRSSLDRREESAE